MSSKIRSPITLREVLHVRLGVLAPNTEQHKQAKPDFTARPFVHRDFGAAYALHYRPHVISLKFTTKDTKEKRSFVKLRDLCGS